MKSSTILLPIGTNLIFKLETPVFPHIFDLCGVVVRFGSANDPAYPRPDRLVVGELHSKVAQARVPGPLRTRCPALAQQPGGTIGTR